MMETLHPLKPDSAPLRVHRPNWAPEPTEVESGSLRENAINQRSRARSDWTVHTVLGRAWHTPSWRDVAPGHPVEMLVQHLKAYK
jgi:hypothetical protein